MLRRTALVPSSGAGYGPAARWAAGPSASIRQMSWDSDGPIITLAPLGAAFKSEPEPLAATTDESDGPQRGLILDILV